MALNYNEQLRRAFERLHDSVVESFNSTPLIDHLFACGVLSSEDHFRLFEVTERSAKTKLLLSILQTSCHPQAFVQLRKSIKRSDANRWLVDEIDRHARPRQTTIHEPHHCGTVVNVAILDDKVFTVSELSDKIKVFDIRSLPDEKIHQIRVDGLKWPTDLTVCPTSGKLFVADSFYFSKCVWQIDISSFPFQVSVCQIRTSCRPWSLSVSWRRLLVVPISKHDFRIRDSMTLSSNNHGDSKNKKRVEFPIEMDLNTMQMKKRNALLLYDFIDNSQGVTDAERLIKRIILPAEMDSHMIHHAVETPRNTFIICHSIKVENGDNHSRGYNGFSVESDCPNHGIFDQVSEVDDRGTVIRVYGGPRGCSSQQFNWPNHLALAPSTSHCASAEGRFTIIVVDRNNCRVILLNNELHFEHVLLNKERNQLSGDPWRLSYAPATGRLVVGFENGSIYAYD